MRGLCKALLVCGSIALASTAGAFETPVRATETSVRAAVDLAPEVEFGKWQGGWFGFYLVPEHLDVGPDGGVDVIVHFNGALMADADYRTSKTNAVVVSIAIKEIVGSAGYARMFENARHMDRILDGVFTAMNKGGQGKRHLRRLGLVSWSAGMGAVGRLLKDPAYFSRVDSVVLLDSMHAGYVDGKGRPITKHPENPVMGLGEAAVDRKGLANMVRFAKLAAEGKKSLVVSASAIRPPDYASASEAARVLFAEVTGSMPEPRADEGSPRDPTKTTGAMRLSYRGDRGQLHVFGWRGGGKRDHFDQLHLVGDMLREHVGLRWRKLAEEEQRAITAMR